MGNLEGNIKNTKKQIEKSVGKITLSRFWSERHTTVY